MGLRDPRRRRRSGEGTIIFCCGTQSFVHLLHAAVAPWSRRPLRLVGRLMLVLLVGQYRTFRTTHDGFRDTPHQNTS